MSQPLTLFNPVFLKQKKVFSSVAMAQALGVLLVGALAMVAFGKQHVAALEKEAASLRLQLVQKETRRALVNAEFAPRTPSAAMAAQMVDAEARLRALGTVSGVLARGELGHAGGYSEYFRALARQDMDGVWLTGVSVANGGADIGIRGRALKGTMVPGYIGLLTREPVMQGKAFSSLQIAQGPQTDGTKAAPFVEFRLESAMQEGGK
ncbi:MAG: hypothetical protein ACXW2U_19790 [Telluria sp.]